MLNSVLSICSEVFAIIHTDIPARSKEDLLMLKSSLIGHYCFCSFPIFVVIRIALALQMKKFCYNSPHLTVFDRSMVGSSASLNIMKNHPNSFKQINFSRFIRLFHSLFS
jgi:hypothetical protein